jgi:hypothetical protein
MLPQNLSPYQFDAPDATSPKLNLTVLTAGYLLLAADATMQRRTVLQASERVQHLWNAIIGEHGDFVNVRKSTIAFTIEAGPQVPDQDLSPLVEADCFALEAYIVFEAGEVLHQQVDQGSCRAVCFGYAVCEAAAKAFVKHLAGFAKAAESLLEERNHFIRSRAKDVSQQIFCEFVPILPEVRTSDWDPYILAINQLATIMRFQPRTLFKRPL